ncbi:MAG: hypothetical protein WC655_13930 [Candidatus Hydrogenedentales bacterium]|jgi:hypothetical protein
MKVRIIVLLLCLGGICLGISGQEQMQIQAFGKSTLAGIKAVSLAVNALRPKDMPDGLMPSESALQTKTELILRRNGIRILPDGEARLDNSRLAVSVVVTKIPTVPAYALTVAVELLDLVTAPRDTGVVLTRATTWPFGGWGLHGPSVVHENRLREYVVESVTTQLEMFCNDYLAANPPEPKPKKTYVTLPWATPVDDPNATKKPSPEVDDQP